MAVPYDQIDESLVGKTVVQISHSGENWWERPAMERTPDPLPISAILREDDHIRILFGQLGYHDDDGRVAAGEGTVVAADLEIGIGPGGWIEVAGD